jgi:CxxC motif-containing protein (DUF1111 family)
VNTGDGIVQSDDQSTANKMRTAPLWGLRTRSRLMHDGQSLTIYDAVMRHGNEADVVMHNFVKLTDAQKAQLLLFLESL